MALSLLAFAQAMSGTDRVQKVGGGFGRAWLEKNLGPKSSPPSAGNKKKVVSSYWNPQDAHLFHIDVYLFQGNLDLFDLIGRYLPSIGYL